jgi:hypothetical protein
VTGDVRRVTDDVCDGVAPVAQPTGDEGYDRAIPPNNDGVKLRVTAPCIRALIGCGSKEAMSIPRPTLDALQTLPCVADMSVDRRARVGHVVDQSVEPLRL